MSPPAATSPRARLTMAFMAGLGLGGWGLLAAATYLPGFGPESPARPDAVSFALFLVVIVAARAMALRPLPGTVVSLDSGLYVAAAVCLGTVTAGRLVAIALTADALFRLLTERRRGRSLRLVYAVYFGGMSGALLMGIGWLFDLDSLYVLVGVPDVLVVVKVLGVGAVFLIAHYAIQGARNLTTGMSPLAYLKSLAIPGILAEAALLPLAAVVVFLYHPDHLLKFVLLGLTYVLVNYAFNRISSTSAKLRQRVSELETLTVTAHRLASALEVRQLVETVGRETLAAIPEAEVVSLTHRMSGEGRERLVVDYVDRARMTLERFDAGRTPGAHRWVFEHEAPLHVSDLARADLGVELHADPGIRSWIGVPVRIDGETEAVLAIQSQKRGAFAPDRLRLLESIGAQAAVALQNARLYEMAMVDGLTGLFVRRYFDARLHEEVQRAIRFGTGFSVVMMDIDNFKQLNDTHGHQVGDRFLRGIAGVVKRGMRAVDTAARYGGEEFALILPRTPMVDALNLAERLRVEIEELRVVVDAEALGTTASFGIASYPESGAQSADSLVRLADRALYRAKRSGKNRTELYWGDDEAAARPTLTAVADGGPTNK